MHPDQLDVTPATVAALVREQFGQWQSLPLRLVRSAGTVNRLYRLGEDLVLRFPLQPGDPAATRESLLGEAAAARRLLGRVSVPTPEPVVEGRPGPGYPSPWRVYRWLPGTVATETDVAGSTVFAHDLAEFVLTLRQLDTDGRTFTGGSRGGLLTGQDDYVTRSRRPSAGLIDVEEVGRLWSRLRLTGRTDGPDLYVHGDLMPGNLLVDDGRLAAVLDVGGLAPQIGRWT